jgi:hypothetical protein
MDFESIASANSATPAAFSQIKKINPTIKSSNRVKQDSESSGAV